MTCKDCIYYDKTTYKNGKPCKNFNRCNKYSGYGYQKYVHRDRETCKDFEPKESLTCGDCVHFNSTEHPKPEWIGYNKCEKHTADGYQEYVGKDSEICEDYEDKDGLYSNGTWHCPKCGKPVSEWGLCNECDSWESVSK